MGGRSLTGARSGRVEDNFLDGNGRNLPGTGAIRINNSGHMTVCSNTVSQSGLACIVSPVSMVAPLPEGGGIRGQKGDDGGAAATMSRSPASDRLALLIGPLATEVAKVAIVPTGAAAMAYRGNLKKRMERATRLGARHAVLVGTAELAGGSVQLKDLATGVQTEITLEELMHAVSRHSGPGHKGAAA